MKITLQHKHHAKTWDGMLSRACLLGSQNIAQGGYTEA